MVRHEEDQTSKRRILDSAVTVFAEKGYDGARVDEIAKRASVNKALIYYYFPRGKEELLETAFLETLEETLKILDLKGMAHFDYNDDEFVKKMVNGFLDILEERQDILRVILMESMKRSPVNDFIYRMIREIIEKIYSTLEKAEAGAIGDREFSMVLEFFTGIMPLVSYVVYHEGWIDRFGMKEPELRERFIKAYIGTHFRYSAQTYANPFPADVIVEALLEKKGE
jgi:AcrR family transcriptional regulator